MNTTTNTDITGACLWDLDLTGWTNDIEADGTVAEFEELVLAAAEALFPRVRFVDHGEHNRLVRGNGVEDVTDQVSGRIGELVCSTVDELREIAAR